MSNEGKIKGKIEEILLRRECPQYVWFWVIYDSIYVTGISVYFISLDKDVNI